MAKYLLNRLREPSTWRGIALLGTVLGINLNPDQINGVVSFGLALSGFIGVFIPDTKGGK